MRLDNILLISDRTPIFPELARLLAQAGYRVTLTFYGQESFQALRTGEFPLVISRCSKDWADTRRFLEAVREPGREIALLFLLLEREFDAPSEAQLFKTDGRQFTSQHQTTTLSANCRVVIQPRDSLVHPPTIHTLIFIDRHKAIPLIKAAASHGGRQPYLLAFLHVQLVWPHP